MRIGSIEVCYIPYNKSQYQIAREELGKLSTREIKNIIVGATFIMAVTVAKYQVLGKLNVNTFTSRVDAEGFKILKLLQTCGYWGAIIFAGIDIVKNFKKQDIAGIMSTVLKYFVSVAILYGLPDILDLARSFFD